MLDAEYFGKLIVHSVEGLAARVSIVCSEHCGLHIVAHSVNTGVGEHIHKDIAVMKKEGVEACLSDLRESFLCGKKVKLLNYLYLMHLKGYFGSCVEFNVCHFSSFLPRAARENYYFEYGVLLNAYVRLALT